MNQQQSSSEWHEIADYVLELLEQSDQGDLPDELLNDMSKIETEN